MQLQCYDLTPDPHVDQQQHHQPASLAPSLPSSVQGPPPSYETVVAMDQSSLDGGGCDKCIQLHRSCSYTNCDHAHRAVLHQHQPPIKLDNEPNNNAPDDDGTRTMMAMSSLPLQPPPPPQILNVPRPMYRCNCDLYQQQTCCGGGGGVDDTAHYEFIKKCKHCGSEINGNYCDCASVIASVGRRAVRSPRDAPPNDDSAAAVARTDNANARNNAHSGGALIATTGRRWPAATSDESATTMTTSTTNANNNDAANDDGEPDNGDDDGAGNCGCESQQTGSHHQRRDDGLNNNNNVVDLNAFNEAGVIRMDMSQIIDQTGLPTYEAALKFESSGYV